MKALTLYTWVIFNEGQKKEWFNITIPFIDLDSDPNHALESLESYLSDNSIIYELNNYSDKHSHGSYNYGVESYDEIEFSFDTHRNDLDIEKTTSPKKREKAIKKVETLENISTYEIDESKIKFEGNGTIVYKDKMFGKVEVNIHQLKDFLNNPIHINASIVNDDGDPVIDIQSDKNEHSGKMLRLKSHADYQFYWDGVPKKTGLFSPDGDVAIYNRPEEDRFDLISDEKWIRFNRQNFFKRLIQLKENGKSLNIVKMIESGINKIEKN